MVIITVITFSILLTLEYVFDNLTTYDSFRIIHLDKLP